MLKNINRLANNNQFPNDHKRIKKTLIAPMNHLFQDNGQFNNFIEISHERVLVPEVFWITYLNNKIGSSKTSDIIFRIIKLANEDYKNDQHYITGLASSFNRLNSAEKEIFRNKLEAEGIVDVFNENISGIKYLFADFPLNFLITEQGISSVEELSYFKAILTKLNDRLSTETTFTFAHLIYPLISIGAVNINPSSVLFNPNVLTDYPNTEESNLIAAHLRMTSKMIDRNLLAEDVFSWRNSFWKQCFKLEPCHI